MRKIVRHGGLELWMWGKEYLYSIAQGEDRAAASFLHGGRKALALLKEVLQGIQIKGGNQERPASSTTLQYA